MTECYSCNNIENSARVMIKNLVLHLIALTLKRPLILKSEKCKQTRSLKLNKGEKVIYIIFSNTKLNISETVRMNFECSKITSFT